MVNYTLKIIKNNINAKVLFDADIDENIVKIVSTDKYNYALIEVVEGTNVTYTILCDGYKTVTNTILMDKNYTLTPELKEAVKLTINTIPDEATVILTCNGKDYKQKTLECETGDVVYYTVTYINKQPYSDSLVMQRDTEISVKLLDEIRNDGDIADYEKDYSDDLNKINTISKKEYESLTDEARSKYMKYTDLLNRIFGVDYNRTLSDCIVQLYWTLPIANKLIPFTNGTLGTLQTDFINYIAQLNTLIASAASVGDKIKSLQKPLNKVGLGSLTDILTTGFGLIGGIGGIIYAIINNPNIFIKTFAQQFTDIDLEDIYNRTIGETIPNLDYLKGMVNRTYLPDNELKKTLLYQINEIGNAADLSLDVLNDLAKLKELVEIANASEDAMRTLIENLSTMGVGWAIAYLTGYIDKLRKDKDKIKYNANNNNLSQAYDVMQSNLDRIMNEMNDYYVNMDDLPNFNRAIDSRTSTQKIFDYNNGYNDALNNAQNGETEEQKLARLEQLKKEMEFLGKDASPYLLGYNNGWKEGHQNYLDSLSYNEQLQKDSFEQGYKDGFSFSADVPSLVKNSLEIGDLKMFIDEDWHIHNPTNRFEPFGRIELGLVYNISGDLIGKLDSNNKILSDNEVIGKLGEKEVLPIGKNYEKDGVLIYRNHQVLGTIKNDIEVYDFSNVLIGTIDSNNFIISEYDGSVIGYKKNVYKALDAERKEIGYVDEKGVVYDFNEDMSERVMGTFDSNTDIMEIFENVTITYHYPKNISYSLTVYKGKYLIVNDEYIYDYDSHTDTSSSVTKMIHDINLMRVQRKPRINYINPYYANGWEEGYNAKKVEIDRINELFEVEENAESEGYLFAQQQKDLEDVSNHLDEYKESDTRGNYSYYSQGFIRGYNRYQSEYNSTYNRGWFMASVDEGSISKNDFLQQIITEYHLENLTPQELAVNSYYMGGNNGWDDSLDESIIEPRYKESYLDY